MYSPTSFELELLVIIFIVLFSISVKTVHYDHCNMYSTQAIKCIVVPNVNASNTMV